MEEQHTDKEAEQIGLGELEDEIVEALRTVYDPELPVNIYDLGLIYELRVETDRTVYIKMTLTAPGCPAAGFLPAEVRQSVQEVPGVKDVQVDLTWDPPYHRDMMSDAAKLELGLF
ncbi:MAG TPA: SUF system Fe-S cluster assembly protein [Rhodothermales bacterium]|nr:SUF system Fe-S cluster assembly protein [Rhodothermales bacterium]